MKRARIAVPAALILVALAGAWMASPTVRAAGYETVLHYGSRSLQLWALRKLEALGEPGYASIVTALSLEKDQGKGVADAADETLRRLGLVALPALADGTRDADPWLRYRAVGITYRLITDAVENADLEGLADLLDGPFKPVLAASIEGLADPAPEIRASHFDVIAAIPGAADQVQDKIIAALIDPDSEVRISADNALDRVNRPDRLALFNTLEGYLDNLARESADPERLPSLKDLSFDEARAEEKRLDPRYDAVRFLLSFAEEDPAADALPSFAKAIASDVTALKNQAFKSLKTFEWKGTIQAALQSEDRQIRAAAVQLSEALKKP